MLVLSQVYSVLLVGGWSSLCVFVGTSVFWYKDIKYCGMRDLQLHRDRKKGQVSKKSSVKISDNRQVIDLKADHSVRWETDESHPRLEIALYLQE